MGEGTGASARLLRGLPPCDADEAATVLAACASVEIEPGVPYFRNSFPSAALLVVDEGFVVVRASFPEQPRSTIACEAGVGLILLPPSEHELVCGFGKTRLTVVSTDARDRLLALPSVAERLVDELAQTLRQNRETIGTFAETRHVERVRRKLLQLAGCYGRVVRDGIRIDFPISHVLLAEMIGSSRETVTRAVDTLQRDGFVARRGHTYRLLVAPECVDGRPGEAEV